MGVEKPPRLVMAAASLCCPQRSCCFCFANSSRTDTTSASYQRQSSGPSLIVSFAIDCRPWKCVHSLASLIIRLVTLHSAILCTHPSTIANLAQCVTTREPSRTPNILLQLIVHCLVNIQPV